MQRLYTGYDPEAETKIHFTRESFIKRTERVDLVADDSPFDSLRDDFISHISEGNIDVSTWYQLHKQMLNWFECLDDSTREELIDRGIVDSAFRRNICTPDKLRNYVIRMRKSAKETLIAYFLADKLSAYLNEADHLEFSSHQVFSQDFFYRYAAQALSIKLNHIDHQLHKKEYLPIININTKNIDQKNDDSIKTYLHELSQVKNTERTAKELFFAGHQIHINNKDYKIRLHSDFFAVCANAIKDKSLPPFDEQIAILFKIKKTLNQGMLLRQDGEIVKGENLTDILTSSTDKQQAQIGKVIEFWFPGKSLQNMPSPKAVKVIDFLIEQVHIMESSKNGRFMIGYYPKNVDDATKILNQLEEVTVIENYRKFKITCKSLSDRTLQDVLSKMLDHLLVIACNERVLDKKAPLFIEAMRLFGHIQFIATNIEKTNIELRDKDNIIRQFVNEVEMSINKIKKSYVGFSWFARLKRDITNWTRNNHRKVAIKNLPTLNKNDFLADMMLLKKSINNNLDARRIHKLIDINIKPQLKVEEVKAKETTSFLSKLFTHFTFSKPAPMVQPEKRADLFNKTLRIIPKKGGAKTGAAYDMLGSDEIQRRFLIKQGASLGETLSELLAYHVYHEAMPTKEQAYAKTHLVVKSADGQFNNYKNPLQFGDHVHVASEYYDSYCTLNACQVAGEKSRPKFIGTRDSLGNPMFDKLIYLNKQCGLGLEYALHAAIRTCDYDFHSENVLLIFDVEKVEGINRPYAMRLVDEFKLLIETKPKKEILVERIKAIQDLGVQVFFQKIDHGYSYKKYQARKLRLDTSNIFLSGFPLDSNGTQATNHIAEWTAGKKGKELLLTDASCDILLTYSVENEMNMLRNAMAHFFESIRCAALDYANTHPEQLTAELHLLKSFYKHAKDMEYIDRPGNTLQKINEIHHHLTDFIIYNRLRLMEMNNTYYLSLLDKIADKDMTRQQHKLWSALREQQPQIRQQLSEHALPVQVRPHLPKRVHIGMAGFQR